MKKSKAKIARRETIAAGRVLYVKETPRRRPAPKGKRAEKRNPTPERMLRLNEHHAIRELAIKIDANFTAGDLFETLTYAGSVPPSEAEAKKRLDKFKSALLRKARQKGVPLRWVATTEYKHNRIHHHVIIGGGLTPEEVSALWPHGRTRTTFLYGETFRGLAEYIIKETRKTFRDPDTPFKRRYSCSLNVKTPPAKTEIVAHVDLDGDPRPPKGYYVDPDSVYRGENPFTGARYLEYTAISLTDEPRIKAWRRGKKTRPRNPASLSAYRKAAPRQTEMRC
jgi:hypothetical protein